MPAAARSTRSSPLLPTLRQATGTGSRYSDATCAPTAVTVYVLTKWSVLAKWSATSPRKFSLGPVGCQSKEAVEVIRSMRVLPQVSQADRIMSGTTRDRRRGRQGG